MRVVLAMFAIGMHQARTDTSTNAAVPQRPVRKTALKETHLWATRWLPTHHLAEGGNGRFSLI